LVTDLASGQRDRFPARTASHAEAVATIIDWLQRTSRIAVAAVGHRIVHGGARYHEPTPITPQMLDDLRAISPFDPEHLPTEIALIEAFRAFDPSLRQLACFDTAFHHDLPRVAQLLPIPRRYLDQGVRRYGFHGLSYTFLMAELARIAGAEGAGGRVVLAHLGNGASMAAVRGGHCLDTTMAFTPTAGLVMGTRTGDLDPGLVAYLARTEDMSAEQFQELVNHQSGLLGVSESSSDMRDLLARRADDPRAAEAVALFCHQARKTIGACAATLGGLDTLVFSGGIGEHSPEVRGEICAGLEFLGIVLDPASNGANTPLISREGSNAAVRVIRTDEESVIAEAVFAWLSRRSSPAA
jgi:acetate kinase